MAAQREWRAHAIEERAAALSAFVDAFVAERDDIATELTWQMGRPIRYTPGVYSAQGEGNRETLVFRGMTTTGDFSANAPAMLLARLSPPTQ